MTTNNATTLYINETWTISRGRDTYGYDLVTMRVSDFVGGREIAKGRADGGGYDLTATALSEALCDVPAVQEALRRAVTPENAYAVETESGWTRRDTGVLYGSHLHKDGRVSFYGSAGFESFRAMLEAAGIEIRPNYRGTGARSKRVGWFVTIN